MRPPNILKFFQKMLRAFEKTFPFSSYIADLWDAIIESKGKNISIRCHNGTEHLRNTL